MLFSPKPLEFYAYHVVTERPMQLGQCILFDETHHNGVWSRVNAQKEIVEDIYKNPEKYAGVELEYPVMVALREFALEEVRQKYYPHYPSRMACLYVSEKLEASLEWAEYFIKLKRPTFQIVRLRISGNCFVGDAANCFDGGINRAENLAQAEHYWKNLPNEDNKEPIREMLVDGKLEVVEIIKEFL